MPTTDLSHIAVIQIAATSIRDYGVPEEAIRQHMRKVMANALAAKIVEDGFMQILEHPAKDQYPGSTEITGTVGVVSPTVVISLEERLQERQDERAERAIERAIISINNWGSDFGHKGISKDIAVGLIREALKE